MYLPRQERKLWTRTTMDQGECNYDTDIVVCLLLQLIHVVPWNSAGVRPIKGHFTLRDGENESIQELLCGQQPVIQCFVVSINL